MRRSRWRGVRAAALGMALLPAGCGGSQLRAQSTAPAAAPETAAARRPPPMSLAEQQKAYEAEVADRDHDGVFDSDDNCPDQPEDKDGYEDRNGCPELDNDRDGFPDAKDKCPNEPEVRNGVEDDDGCPDLVHLLRAPVPGC